MTIERCRYGFGGDGCAHTYAELFGSYYVVVQMCTVVITVLLSTLCAYQIRQLVRTKRSGFPFPMDLQNTVHVLMAIASLSFLVRMVDPQAYNNILPVTLVVVLGDLTTACLFSVALAVVHVWLLAISLHPTDSASLLIRFFQVFIWLFLLACGACSVLVGPMWEWHIVKLSGALVVMMSTCVLATVFGARIYWTLRVQQDDEHDDTLSDTASVRRRRQGDTRGTVVATPNEAKQKLLNNSSNNNNNNNYTVAAGDGDSSDTRGGGHGVASASTSIMSPSSAAGGDASSSAGTLLEEDARVTMARRQALVRRIFGMILSIDIISVVACVVIVRQLFIDARVKYTVQSAPVPTHSHLFWRFALELVQAVACIVALLFFRPREAVNRYTEACATDVSAAAFGEGGGGGVSGVLYDDDDDDGIDYHRYSGSSRGRRAQNSDDEFFRRNVDHYRYFPGTEQVDPASFMYATASPPPYAYTAQSPYSDFSYAGSSLQSHIDIPTNRSSRFRRPPGGRGSSSSQSLSLSQFQHSSRRVPSASAAARPSHAESGPRASEYFSASSAHHDYRPQSSGSNNSDPQQQQVQQPPQIVVSSSSRAQHHHNGARFDDDDSVPTSAATSVASSFHTPRQDQ
eukprot:TRINITY_DN66989_c9_g4_i1.p1 TRINITY_DN66989_c9_g4~~TRINITY_DN66989_c9_g4_i1.p1  ORF type:complete len:635 (-),score=301.18 TRINITY_DN66989_c9_g4_i1:97-1980(-)